MIDYNNENYEMQMGCDNAQCDEESTFIGTFQECIREAKDEGWRIYLDKHHEWTHICPFCVHDPRKVF